MTYPKPPGWKGGPDGHILRQGSAGHLGWNPNTDAGDKFTDTDRENCQSFEDSCFGGC